jgi:hypothetical protein
MSDKAVREREKQVENLRSRQQKAMQVREFLISEKEIVVGLLEKALKGQDQERIDNLRTRVQEKDRQFQLVEEELKEIDALLAEAGSRLRESRMETEGD